MRFSEAWLRELVDPALSSEELVAQLTMAGLEVDAVDPVAESFTGVVVGQITAVEPHPQADKLRICQVSCVDDNDSAPYQVVCGAPNARMGIKVPFARVGSQLPGGLKIKKTKLRGVESHGMLCGQTELQLGDDDSGLWELPQHAPVGEELREYLGLNDQIIEVDLTPNRSDCLSITGLAREVAALNGLPYSEPRIDAAEVVGKECREVTVEVPAACPVYAGRVISNINIQTGSPLWLTEKLRRSGIRSIDPVVDVTNYVLLELGQPLHAFDHEKLKGVVSVRMARADEPASLLDGQTIRLREDTLVIADDSGVQAVAGVMGCSGTAVSGTTRSIFLESAFFSPLALAGKARAYGLHTDSSHRFERGVDYLQQVRALERATALLLDITGGEAGPIILRQDAEQLPTRNSISLRKTRVDQLLGRDFSGSEIESFLQRLGLQCEQKTDGIWHCLPPSYRFDLTLEVDLVEEIARVYGYNHLPVASFSMEPLLQPHSERQRRLVDLKQHLVSRRYQEVITYSFIDPALHDAMFPEQPAVTLRNPISADMGQMRTSLLPGLIKTLKTNLNRQQSRIRLFESGLRFLSADGGCERLQQELMIAGLIYGSVHDAEWSSPKRDTDFFDLKGDIESLLACGLSGKAVEYRRSDIMGCFHPGQAAEVIIDGLAVGILGALHPELTGNLGFSKPVYAFELLVGPILQSDLPRFTPISRFPEVTRDLAIVAREEVSYSDLSACIQAHGGPSLKAVKLFDVYTGEGITAGDKSLAFNLIFQDASRTLNESEVNSAMSCIVRGLQDQHKATLR